MAAVADKMPLWDADAISRYERVEIATVKADIAMAQQEEGKGRFLEYVTKLHQDWDALVALDIMLKEESPHMSSKYWIERAIKKPGTFKAQAATRRRKHGGVRQ